MSRISICLVCVALVAAFVAPARAQDAPARPDLMTFAAGALPLSVGGTGTEIGTSFEQAIEAIDGDPGAQVINRQFADATTDFIFTYALPSATTFDRFAVPEIGETPSPSQTFVGHIEVSGALDSPDGAFTTLATGSLAPHAERGMVTELTIEATIPVRYVRVRLSGSNEDGAVFLEFSELIGNGTQEAVALSDAFDGIWDATRGLIELHQEGPVVTGCADNGRKALTGTVSGNLLYATMTDNSTGIPSAMIVAVDPSGSLWGVRSDNGAPFALYNGPPADEGTTTDCSAPETPPVLGCGSVVHGIQFAYDSAELLPASDPVLDSLFDGLSSDGSSTVSIIGHTSSEGDEDYNADLSQRRAQSVVDALVARGIDAGRLSSVGRGEHEPIADNDTETGRALNRRVEVVCAAD